MIAVVPCAALAPLALVVGARGLSMRSLWSRSGPPRPPLVSLGLPLGLPWAPFGPHHSEKTIKTTVFFNDFTTGQCPKMDAPKPPLHFAHPPRGGPRPQKFLRARPRGLPRGPRAAHGLPISVRTPPNSGQVSQKKNSLPTGTTATIFGTWPYYALRVAKNEGCLGIPLGAKGGLGKGLCFLLHVPCNIDGLPEMLLWLTF